MNDITKIGIIICHRYRRCGGGKCFKAMRQREGAFKRYLGINIELVGYTTCDGCPGGNIEYAGDEMVKNGVDVIHLATGLIVGYPPCPYINFFTKFLQEKYKIEVVPGTHPIPTKYYNMHNFLATWSDPSWQPLIAPTLCTEELRAAYD
jgi:predicted metal-binding protein